MEERFASIIERESGIKWRIKVSDIHRFDEKKHSNNKLKYYKFNSPAGRVLVGSIDRIVDSEDQLKDEEKLGKRIRKPSSKYSLSPSDSSDTDVTNVKKKKTEENGSQQSSHCINKALESRLKKFNPEIVKSITSLRTIPAKTISPPITEKVIEEKNTERNLSNKDSFPSNSDSQELNPVLENQSCLEKIVIPMQIKNKNSNLSKTKNSCTTIVSSESQRGNKVPENKKLIQTNKPHSASLNMPKAKKSSTIESKQSNKHFIKKAATSISRPLSDISNQTLNSSNNLFIENVINEKDKHLSTVITKNISLQKTIKNQDELIKQLRSENVRLLQGLEELKINITESNEKLEKMTLELEKIEKLNYEWQENSLNKCELICKMFINMNQLLKDNETDEFRAPTGHECSGQIHLGRGVWISKQTYQLASNNIRLSTKKKFVRNISVAVFGYDVLSASTVTGRASNRNKRDIKPEALDPAKLLAVKDIYRYFLINTLRMTAEAAEMEADQTNRYISKKIAQLKQVYEKPSKNGRKLLGTNNEGVKNVVTQEESDIADHSEPNDQEDVTGSLESDEDSDMDDPLQSDQHSDMHPPQSDALSEEDDPQQLHALSNADDPLSSQAQAEADDPHQHEYHSDTDDSVETDPQIPIIPQCQNSKVDVDSTQNFIEQEILRSPANFSENEKKVLDILLSDCPTYDRNYETINSNLTEN